MSRVHIPAMSPENPDARCLREHLLTATAASMSPDERSVYRLRARCHRYRPPQSLPQAACRDGTGTLRYQAPRRSPTSTHGLLQAQGWAAMLSLTATVTGMLSTRRSATQDDRFVPGWRRFHASNHRPDQFAIGSRTFTIFHGMPSSASRWDASRACGWIEPEPTSFTSLLTCIDRWRPRRMPRPHPLPSLASRGSRCRR